MVQSIKKYPSPIVRYHIGSVGADDQLYEGSVWSHPYRLKSDVDKANKAEFDMLSGVKIKTFQIFVLE